MLRYLRELELEDVKEFPNVREFERHFFSSLVLKPVAKPKHTQYLEGLPPDVVQHLGEATFAQEPALQDGTTEIEIDATSGQILRVNIARIFGRTVTELVAKSVSLETIVLDKCRPLFKSALEAMKAPNDKPHMFVFQSDKNELWVAEVSGRSTEKTYVLKLTDHTADVAKGLGKTQKKEKAPVEDSKNPVDLIIFRPIDQKPDVMRKWVTKTATLLKKAERWPPDNRPKFIALRYEDDPAEKAEYNHPFIDDLLCLPLDRLIFLQKLEIVLAIPKKPSPSFLFVQETLEKVEVAKRVYLERFCDQGFAMANPVPLTEGTGGHFYFRFPGQAPLLDFYGKVIRSEPHPDREGEFLVYFAFFGLTKANNRELRQYLQRDTAHKQFVDNDPKLFEFNHENIFLSDEEKKRKTLVVLDPDENTARSIYEYARKEIGNLDVVWDDSYYSFFKTYIDKKNRIEKASPSVPQDFYADIVGLLIGLDLNLQMPITAPEEGQLLLGHDAVKLFSTPQGWLDVFAGDTRNQLTEIMYLIPHSKRVRKNMDLASADGVRRTVAAEFILEETSGLIRINLRAPDIKMLSNSRSHLESIQSLEVIVIDQALLPDNVPSFLTGLRDALKEANISCPADGPKIIVTAAESRQDDVSKLLNEPAVAALTFKPAEMRRLLYVAAHLMRNPFTIYRFDNVPWKNDHIHAKIGRECDLVELSEFGCVIQSNQPLKPGSMFYLFRSIYVNAPDQNLCVRIYHSQESESEKGTYLNSALYFGITDAFLKFTRSFIRETYASKKAKEVS